MTGRSPEQPTPSVAVTTCGPVPGGEAHVSWTADVAAEDVRAAVDEVLSSGAAERVVARVSLTDRRSISVAGRAGLRREGIERSVMLPDGSRGDVIRLARLAEDPAPTTPEGFRGVLNAGLNRTRVIAQALITDPHDRVLLCELTYKKYWDLPGGVVDPAESPAAGLAREVREELGTELPIGDLAVVSWLPPWQGWDDAVLFLFRAAADPNLLEAVHLEPREIAGLHWVEVDDLNDHVADYTARLIRAGLRAAHTLYLEDGRAPT